MNFTKGQIDYYIEKTTMLAKLFEQQYQELYMLCDYLTEDIASDWIIQDVLLLEEMFKYKIISYKVIDLYKAIEKNFADVSLGGRLYNDIIWTLKGLKYHPFWEQQRNLAKELLNELQKVQIEQFFIPQIDILISDFKI